MALQEYQPVFTASQPSSTHKHQPSRWKELVLADWLLVQIWGRSKAGQVWKSEWVSTRTGI